MCAALAALVPHSPRSFSLADQRRNTIAATHKKNADGVTTELPKLDIASCYCHVGVLWRPWCMGQLQVHPNNGEGYHEASQNHTLNVPQGLLACMHRILISHFTHSYHVLLLPQSRPLLLP